MSPKVSLLRKFDFSLGPVAIVLIGLIASTDAFWIYLATTAAITYVLAASFNVVYGYCGIFSMAHVALYGIGAYTGVLLQTRAGVPFLLAIVGAMIMCGLLGLMLWWPTRSLRDLYLAIATLGFAVAVEELILKWTSITGGGQGLLGIPPAEILGYQFLSGKMPFFWLAGAGALLAWEITRRLDRSGLGRRMVSYRDSPLALASTGDSPQRIRAIAFVVSGGLAGLAGVLFAHNALFISSESFGLGRLIALVLAVLLGGLGTRLGPIIGVVALVAIDELGASFVDWRELIFGVSIIVLLGYMPGGIMGALGRLLPPRSQSRNTVSAQSHLEVRRRRLSDSSSSPSSLSAEGISVAFGGIRALDDVSFTLRSGEVLGLIGPNGAGKTTLLNSLTGHVSPSSGRLVIDGQTIKEQRSFAIARLGLARTFQTPRLVNDDSVVDNVMIGSANRRTASTIEEILDIGRARKDTDRAYALAYELMDWFKILPLANEQMGQQPYSVGKFVEIARCVAMDPKFILLDEPGAGLTDVERDRLVEVIRHLASEGIGIVLIDHNVSFVREASDEILVLDQGASIAQGDPTEVLKSDAVVRAYLGGGNHG